MQIQISWLLQKPTDLDLHCLQRQGISGFSRTRVRDIDILLGLLYHWPVTIITLLPLDIPELSTSKARDYKVVKKFVEASWLAQKEVFLPVHFRYLQVCCQYYSTRYENVWQISAFFTSFHISKTMQMQSDLFRSGVFRRGYRFSAFFTKNNCHPYCTVWLPGEIKVQ